MNPIKKYTLLGLLFIMTQLSVAQRIGNYVANGSFEETYVCSAPPTYTWSVINWSAQTHDTSCFSFGYFSTCLNRMPKSGSIYQYARSGNSYILLSVVYGNNYWKAYAKNRLKKNLQAGKIYCVKFYVNISNPSTYGVDGIGAYFFGNAVDTITTCYPSSQLSYISPQVQNPQGNIITDTLNWIPITGTFTASGTEKYLLLGNFLSDSNTDALLINPTYLPAIWTDFSIDDVSCIPIDLEAYAGRDTTIYLGDSIYIGRETDFAIDTGCVWYQLPNTTTAIDTISGMWVKPNATGSYTYIVRQELECSGLKWDTVVVTVRDFDVGLTKFEVESLKLEVEIYPNPASGKLSLILNPSPKERDLTVFVYDLLGKATMSEEINMKNGKAEIDVSRLENGVYFVKINGKQNGSVTKKLVVAK